MPNRSKRVSWFATIAGMAFVAGCGPSQSGAPRAAERTGSTVTTPPGEAGPPEAAPADAARPVTADVAAPADAPRPAPASKPSSSVKTLTGTLHSGIVAAGGETTGWVLAGDGQTGGVEVNVSAVEKDAKALDGKRVTVTGALVERPGVERGKRQVLVAEKIAPAESAKSRGG